MEFLVENWAALVTVLWLALNLLNAVLKLVPKDQGEQEGGWLHTLLGWLDKLSVLTRANAKGTVKLPLTDSKG